MNDDASSTAPPPSAAHAPVRPLPYAAPGAHAHSQWITDSHPGGGWLVGCLIVLSVVGVVGGAIVGVAVYLLGWW